MTDRIDISLRDDDAIRMKAAWKKMMNYAASFAHDFRKQIQAFPPGKYASDKYGAEWTFGRWMLLKVGPSEKTALQMIEFLDRTASTADQERDRQRLAEIKAEKKAERDRIKAEADALKQRKAEAKQLAAKAKEKAKPAPTHNVLPFQPRKGKASAGQRKMKHDRDLREKAIELVVANLMAGGNPRGYEIGKELGIKTGIMDRLVAVARDRFEHQVSQATSAGTRPADG